jgi:hypothetical protein
MCGTIIKCNVNPNKYFSSKKTKTEIRHILLTADIVALYFVGLYFILLCYIGMVQLILNQAARVV